MQFCLNWEVIVGNSKTEVVKLIEIQRKKAEKLQVKNLNEVMVNLSKIYEISTLSHRHHHRHRHSHTEGWCYIYDLLFGQIKKVISETTAVIEFCVRICLNNQQMSVWRIKANSLSQKLRVHQPSREEADNYYKEKIDKTATVKCKPIPGGHQQLMTRPEDTKGQQSTP